MMNLADLARALPQSVLYGDGSVRFSSVSTDSRTLTPGALFVALRGPRFDGHEYAAQAVSQGASALLVERPLQVPVPQLMVGDARRALGLGAAHWRSRFAQLPLIAVTGSNGKTTVTQMLGAILAQAFGAERRLVTRGNLNNDIGLPLMLWQLSGRHRIAALELGMNHPGEIATLAQWAQPTVAVVNNAQREHQEFLDSVEATAYENGAVLGFLPAEGVAVFPADDPCAPIWRRMAGTYRVMDFALRGDAAVTADVTVRADGLLLSIATPSGVIDTRLNVGGLHNVHNALAATAAALAAGVAPAQIAAGLSAFKPVSGRGVRHLLDGGAMLIDDSYNANPDSVRAAIDVLAQLQTPRTLVLGDMGEVGSRGPQFHQEVGAYARERGIHRLLALGEQSLQAVRAFGEGASHFNEVEPLIEAARVAGRGRGSLLVKGSRFMRMERVVQALLGSTGSGTPGAPGTSDISGTPGTAGGPGSSTRRAARRRGAAAAGLAAGVR
jgi:UDP-N-acetylmuramoyl-tripeptide--D-alanyl-D-alanine ligase